MPQARCVTGHSRNSRGTATHMGSKETVYVIGAGFSAGLGYPLTSDMLVRLWERIDDDLQDRLGRIIRFHHPGFDPTLFTTFPNVEQLLSEMQINDQLFDASRQYEGKFTKTQLRNLQTDLLLHVTRWFHEISERVFPITSAVAWLENFREQIIAEEAAIISFNWDLVLDKLLFADAIDATAYGFGESSGNDPCLLKPHGSLNWFERKLGKHLKNVKRVSIFDKQGLRHYLCFP